jgi:hypothetical protein
MNDLSRQKWVSTVAGIMLQTILLGSDQKKNLKFHRSAQGKTKYKSKQKQAAEHLHIFAII